MDKDQEYYHSSSGFCTYFADVEGRKDLVVVKNKEGYDGDLVVVDRASLQKFEDTYEYKQRTKQKEELEAITKKAKDNLNDVASKIVDRALADLASRIKFNAMFGKGGNLAWSGMVIDELEKLIKDKPVEKLEKKGIFD